jgi:3-hydroxyacyl-CoA dehydrogenase
MGSGIAIASLLSGYNVLIKEIEDEFLQNSLKRIKGIFFIKFKIQFTKELKEKLFQKHNMKKL